MTPDEALAFVERHGVVLMSAKGPVPRLTEAIVGGPVTGSWWAHPGSHAMFRIFTVVGDSPDVLTCRLVGGKVTFVHRRLWPALIRAAAHFPAHHLAKTDQEHTAKGHHIRHDVPFPDWADAESVAKAAAMTEEEALAALGSWACR
jgi:hypothetical protein